MIIFKTIRYKNFLSTGNTFTEIDLTRNKSTLVIGQNGAGKSTMLDALAFALFGKPHRNISKSQLVNSINQKNCLVEVEFTIGSSKFKICRGIKPGIFEIWKNGAMMNQSSHVKEYQKILETNILKINHKSFHQVVVLGSSSFIPFMQLQQGNRRDVIEELLDIGVFSKMNQILREQINSIKDNLKEYQYQIDLTKNKIDTQQKYIQDVKTLTDQNVSAKEASIKESEKEIGTLLEENTELSAKVENQQVPIEEKISGLHDKKQSLLSYNATFKQQMGQITKDAKFYEDNESCPTCSQDISSDLREEKLNESRDKAKELKSAMDKLATESNALEQALSSANNTLSEIREWQSTIHTNNKEIGRLQGQIRDLKADLENNVTADLNQANAELVEIKDKLSTLQNDKLKTNEEYQYNLAISEMLKDTGIKTKIIKQYIPVINTLVNQYLQVLDFFVHFDLNEEFKETIRSRHRDEFTYASFSEGEKQRIDLALLFTWRHVAKMKNSVATNLLILDETFDSSLDHDGVENLLKILESLEDDTNVFVISHKGDILDGKFDAKIEFAKERNFSKMAA